MKLKILIYLSLYILFLGVVSCDSTDFVYVDDSTFNRQVENLENGFIEIVLNVDPKKERGYKAEDTTTPWPVLRENRFAEKSQNSDELCELLANVINRGQRYLGDGWYPTYQVYIKHPMKRLVFWNSEMYLIAIFDFKNRHIFVSGRAFELAKEEVSKSKQLLESLLDNDKLF